MVSYITARSSQYKARSDEIDEEAYTCAVPTSIKSPQACKVLAGFYEPIELEYPVL